MQNFSSILPHPLIIMQNNKISDTVKFLRQNGNNIDKLIKDYGFDFAFHPKKNLMLLNYPHGMERKLKGKVKEVASLNVRETKINNDRPVVVADDPIISECRGIVFEVVDIKARPLIFVRIVAQGFSRFWHLCGTTKDDDYFDKKLIGEYDTKDSKLQNLLSEANSNFCFQSGWRTQEKVDGSFYLMYKYKGEICLSSRNGFAEETDKKDLIFQTLGISLDLNRDDDHNEWLDDNTTLCIEFCSKENRIVRYHDTSRVYLIGKCVRPSSSPSPNPRTFQLKCDCDCERESESKSSPESSLESEYNFVETSNENESLTDYMNKINEKYSLKFSRPWESPKLCKNLTELEEILMDRINEDPTTEGLVLIDKNLKRLKLKTNLYKICHKLKFMDWIVCTPSFIFPLLLSTSSYNLDWILKYMNLNMDISSNDINDTYTRRIKINERVLPCKLFLQELQENIFQMWIQLSKDIVDIQDKKLRQNWIQNYPSSSFVDKYKTGSIKKCNLLQTILYYMSQHHMINLQNLHNLQNSQNLKNYIIQNILPQFTQKIIYEFERQIQKKELIVAKLSNSITLDPIVSVPTMSDEKSLKRVNDQHSEKTYGLCNLRKYLENNLENNSTHDGKDGMSTSKPRLEINDNGIRKWYVECYCGKEMKLVKLKHQLHIPTYCHCGYKQKAVKTYMPRTLIWMCGDKMCEMTMEAQQRNQTQTQIDPEEKQDHLDSNIEIKYREDPLGHPASTYCKNLRLIAHTLIRRLIKYHSWTLEQSYQWLSKELNISRSECHMAQMGIRQCQQVIMILQDKCN